MAGARFEFERQFIATPSFSDLAISFFFISLTTTMTWPHTKEYARSSVLIHPAIFALQSEKTTDLEIYTSILKARRKQYDYPGWMKFSDEGGKGIKGDLIYYIRPETSAANQYDWFVPKTATGLTQAGLSRIN